MKNVKNQILKRGAAVFMLAVMVCILTASNVFPATFTVTSTADVGAGSLRDAILAANATPGSDIIDFAIPGTGPHIISPVTNLPFITDQVTIDGYTQAGAAPATATSDAVIKIVLDGAPSHLGIGLYLSMGSSGSLIRGLAVGGFMTSGSLGPATGIFVLTPLNTIEGNLIGTNASGTLANQNLFGILLVGDDADDNTVGGNTPAARNLISRNGIGVGLAGGVERNKVLGNYIGTDLTGTVALGNRESGVLAALGATQNEIGGSGAGEGNLISGNGFAGGILIGVPGGVVIDLGAPLNSVEGNFIGTDVTGTLPISNFNSGVRIGSGDGNFVGGNTIAFTVAGSSAPGNGIFVTQSKGNNLRDNSIHSNADLGIDLSPVGVTLNDDMDGDGGTNLLQNFPVLTNAIGTPTVLTITGNLNTTPLKSDIFIQFFASEVCNGDVSGLEEPNPAKRFGEGKTPIGSVVVSSDANGNAPFSINLPVSLADSTVITATATSPEGNTSEFSECIFAKVTALPNNLAMLADEDIEIHDPLATEGDLHANNDIEFKRSRGSTHTGNLTAVDDIEINRGNTIVGDATAGDRVKLFGDAEVTGVISENAAVDSVSMPVISFSAGGSDVTVPEDGSTSLAPGSYGEVEVTRGGTLLLSTGEYFMESLETERESYISIDVAGGSVTINVTNNLEFDRRVEVIITPFGDERSHLVTFNSLQNRELTIDDNARVLGTIMAPYAKVELEEESIFKGAICAKEIKVQSGATFLPHGSEAPLPASISLLAENSNASDGENSSDLNSIPTEYELIQNFPNPFNPTTAIRYALPEASQVSLKIYNIQGQLVKSLVSTYAQAGIHQVVWDSKNEQGALVASGAYIYRITAGNFVQTKKMILMR